MFKLRVRCGEKAIAIGAWQIRFRDRSLYHLFQEYQALIIDVALVVVGKNRAQDFAPPFSTGDFWTVMIASVGQSLCRMSDFRCRRNTG
jgi:hypothetical protein